MRIIHAEVSAFYSGRGNTKLPRATRILIIKDDNSISIHSDKGYKPLNYMNPPLEFIVEESGEKFIFKSKKEKLEIILHKIISDEYYDLSFQDPGLSRDGTEHQLQKWLSENLSVLDEDFIFIQREFETGAGPVDILANDKNGSIVLIEVKRWANMNSVGQIKRYVDSLREHDERPIYGVLASVEFNSRSFEIAERNNIRCISIPVNWNETLEKQSKSPKVSLFDFGN